MAQKQTLIVEDEEDIQKLIKYNLSKEGYQVICAGYGEAGLHETRKHYPDLMIMDLMLPEMNWLEVCRQLKSHSKTVHIPIIVLTANREEADGAVDDLNREMYLCVKQAIENDTEN